MDQQSHSIPFDLEAPVPIMFWDPLEFVVGICLVGFGVITDLFFFGVLGAVIVMVASKYLKRGAKRGAMQHYLWSLGLQLDVALKKHTPPAWHNDFIE